ncbi:hypothetical protein ACNFIA_14750 [Pseudomonas sp. NY15437]|uniref:hypothetical protein n=1 Tax=Pseudomonas sp. NY15437 TaxID=3400360 RepID=UPI003A8B358C
MKEAMIVDSAEAFLEAISAMKGNSVVLPIFKGWPNFHVEIEGDRYKGTLTPRLMMGLVEFHEQLLRAYAEVRYGSPVLTRLTHAEKAELDLIFEISKGCTDGKSPLDEFLNKILSALPMNKMSGGQVTAFLIVAVLSFAGYHVFSEWNANDLEKARFEADQKTAELNAKVVGKLADALAGNNFTTEAARVRDRASEGYRAIVSSAPDATSMEIQGQHFNADELEHIRAQEPKDRVRSERREEVLIEMIKRNQDYLALTLRLPEEEYSFPGRVELSTFDPDKLDRLFDAIKHAKPIRLFHYSVMENGRILRTSVLAVDDVSGKD